MSEIINYGKIRKKSHLVSNVIDQDVNIDCIW